MLEQMAVTISVVVVVVSDPVILIGPESYWQYTGRLVLKMFGTTNEGIPYTT
jgi:hypothetical protein